MKRALFCGIIWCLGSLGCLADPGRAGTLLGAALLLGIAECALSFGRGKNSHVALTVILIGQAIYYLIAFGYCLLAAEALGVKLLGGMVAAGMLGITTSAAHAVWKKRMVERP